MLAEAKELSGPAALGSYLKSTRLGRGLKLRGVEEASNQAISNAYLSQLENGKITKPSPHILYTLATVYGISYENLMERAGYIVSASAPRDDGTKHGKAATFSIEFLNSDEENALLEYLAFYRQKRKA